MNKMKKALIILIFAVLIIIISLWLSNLPFDINYNHNLSYQQTDIQMKKLWYWVYLTIIVKLSQINNPGIKLTIFHKIIILLFLYEIIPKLASRTVPYHHGCQSHIIFPIIYINFIIAYQASAVIHENTYYGFSLNIFSMMIFPNRIWLLNGKWCS